MFYVKQETANMVIIAGGLHKIYLINLKNMNVSRSL